MLKEFKPPRLTVLRPRDQAVIAACVLLVLAWTLGSWLIGGGRNQVNLDAAPKQTYRFVVDINKASWPEIAQLPGIGETVARRIVESREADGPFRSVEDLTRVRGVGKNTVQRIKPYLTPLDGS